MKAAGKEDVELAKQLPEVVFNSSEIPADWEESFILNLYKCKVVTLGSYHSLKLTGHEPAGTVQDGEHRWDAGWLCAWKRYHCCHLHCSPAAGELHHHQQTALSCFWVSVWRNGLCVSFRACAPILGVMYGSVVSTVRSLAYEWECIRDPSLAHCSSPWCWKRLCMSFALVGHGSFSMLMNWCSSLTHWRYVCSSSRRGRLAWKVKISMPT